MSETITWTDSINPPWAELTPISIGNIPPDTEIPEQHVLVARNNQPFLRIDAFRNFEESFTFKDAVIWRDFLVIGWGHCVYLIHTESMTSTRLECDSYFGSLYWHENYLLVASGERLIRVAHDGSIIWQSGLLGIDGVIVNDVRNGIVEGSGEWDPPGGWKPFQISLESGQLAKAT